MNYLERKIDAYLSEVKASNATSKSLQALIKCDKYAGITWGVKLVDGNIGYANDVLTLLYFCTFLLKRYLSIC